MAQGKLPPPNIEDVRFHQRAMIERVERALDETFLTYGVHPEAIKKIRKLSKEYQIALGELGDIIFKRKF
jgi:hypothetical protein